MGTTAVNSSLIVPQDALSRCLYACSIGGKESPAAKDIKEIIESVGIDCDDSKMSQMLDALKGSSVQDLITKGIKEMGSVPMGGVAVSAAPAAAAASAAPAQAAKEEKKAESEEESDDDMGFGLFD